MPNDKSGYQIRTELLHLATQILRDNADRKMGAYHNAMEKMEVNPKIADNPLFLSVPQYTVEEVIDQAKKLNEFVKMKS